DATGGESRAHLPVETLGLPVEPVAPAVESDFGHQQRLFAGEVLQPIEIALEPLARLQINVEAEKIEERQAQVLRRRKIDVGNERARILLLHDAIKSLDKALDAAPAVPANDRRRYLVAHGVAKQRCVA